MKGPRTMSIEELLWPLRHDPVRSRRLIDYMCAREVLKGHGSEIKTIDEKGGFGFVAEVVSSLLLWFFFGERGRGGCI